jgi:flagellar hook-basal body complex protein FliE
MIDTMIKGLGIPPASLGKLGGQASKPSAPFADALKGAITETTRLQNEADRTAVGALTGNTANLHQAMIALEKADISFKTMLQVRNRVLEAYQEIMRIQV